MFQILFHSYNPILVQSNGWISSPGDPYYPNQGNRGWIEEDPEEEEEPIELDEEDDFGTDSEPEVINPPPAQPPVFVRNFQGPTPV